MRIDAWRSKDTPPAGLEMLPVRQAARPLYRRLFLAGLTAREAGTLAGRVQGLPVVQGGWAIREVEHLLFVRALVESGRIRP